MSEFSHLQQRAFNLDCMVGMKEFPDKYFELAIVDPPYGIDVAKLVYTQEDSRPCKQKNGKILRIKGNKYQHGDWDKSVPTDEYYHELFRVSKNQIVWGYNYQDALPVGGAIIWDKCVPDGVSFSDAEIAYCSLHRGVRIFKYLWSGFSQGKSVTEGHLQRGDKSTNEARIHPTQKPIELYKWLLKNYAKPGDKILDTHLGSGSSRIAAADMGFDFTGYEIDKDYFEAQEKRFRQFTSQIKIFTR